MAAPPQTHVHRTDKKAFYQFSSTAVRWNQSGLGTRLSLYMAGACEHGWYTVTGQTHPTQWVTLHNINACPFQENVVHRLSIYAYTCTVYRLCTLNTLPDIISCLSCYCWHCLQRPDFHQECIIEGYVVLIKLDYINRWLIGYHTENTITLASDHSPQRMHEQRRSTLTKLEPLWAWLI